MTHTPRLTPPHVEMTKPPWMLTPPRSAEKLLRALSIGPQIVAETSTLDDDSENAYFAHLNHITSPSYRDPPVPSALPAKPKDEPLFLDDSDDDEIQIGTDNRMVLFKSPDTPSPSTVAIKRPHEDDDDIEFTGAALPPDGIPYLGTPVKRRKRVKQEKLAKEEEEEEEEEKASQLVEVDETLQEVAIQRGCLNCRCFCNTVGVAPRRSGTGSKSLSPRVLGDLLHMLMGEGHSLLSITSRTHPDLHTWADIAERVGARREDFDRVRHAASGMQQDLPKKKARGEF